MNLNIKLWTVVINVAINIGSSILTNIPHRCNMLIAGELGGGREREYMGDLRTFYSIFL